MTTPASGRLSIGNISVELLRPSNARANLGEKNTRELLGVPSGEVSMSRGYNKTWIVPGQVEFGFNGSWQYFSVKRYQFMTIELWAAGAGATGYCGNDGWCYGYCGGAGGAGGWSYFGVNGAVAAEGGYNGGGGGRNFCPGSGRDGNGYGGNIRTGGGGAGGYGCNRGGSGGYLSRTFRFDEPGAPAYFSTIGVYVGGGGGGGGGGECAPPASSGANGYARIRWY